MGAFGGLVLTNRGRNLQLKAQTGKPLNFTRIALGDGTLGGASILDLNALRSERKSLNITKLKILGDGKVVVGGTFSNSDITTGFYWREIGLFAMDPDVGEILYSYGNSGSNAEFIPAGGGADIVEKTIDLITIVGNAANVSATINQSLIFETPEGAQEKANAAEANAKTYTDQRVAAIIFPVTSVNNKTGAVTLTATDVGASPTGHTHTFEEITSKPTTLSGYGITDAIPASQKGAANGVASLDGSAKVPTTQLPSASTTQAGIVQLNDTTNSTSTNQAATANAVKQVNDALAAHSAETMQDGVHGLATTQDITYYVDVTNGNDNNDGLSPATAFKTIQKAIDSLPRILNHNATINLAAGTYMEKVLIKGFLGNGILSIQGNISTPDNVKIEMDFSNADGSVGYAFYIEGCFATIQIKGIYIRQTISNKSVVGIRINNCQTAVVEKCKIENFGNSSLRGAIYASNTVSCSTLDNTLNSNYMAIICYTARVFSRNNTGSGNIYGLISQAAGAIGKSGTQPSATNTEYIAEGGTIR